MEQCIADFTAYLRNEKKSPENTVLSYSRDLKGFCRFMQEAGVSDAAKVNRTNVMAYVYELQKQKKAEGEVLVTTVLFNHESQTIHDRVEIDKVPLLTENDYCVGGCTALLDAVGETVEHIKNIHKYARAEDVPQHTLFVITTDGMENASTKYSCVQVKRLIEEQKERGWEFLFFGANIDAVDVGHDLGIAKERVANFNNDAKGINLNFAVVSEAVSCLRTGKQLKADWKKKIDEDYKNRKK